MQYLTNQFSTTNLPLEMESDYKHNLQKYNGCEFSHHTKKAHFEKHQLNRRKLDLYCKWQIDISSSTTALPL